MAIPFKSIRKKELFTCKIDLLTPHGFMELNEISLDSESGIDRKDYSDERSVDVETRSRRISYLYYSSKFKYDPRMEKNATIEIFPILRNKQYTFYYSQQTLPIYWLDNSEVNPFWTIASRLAGEELLTTSPFEKEGE